LVAPPQRVVENTVGIKSFSLIAREARTKKEQISLKEEENF
jgi:hypothetical protein